MNNTVETIEQRIKKQNAFKAYLLKELADSIGELKDALLASYKIIEFDLDTMLSYFNDFIKAQVIFERLSEDYISMGWFSFFDAPKSWFENVASLRMILGDDDNELGRITKQVIIDYNRFISALLGVEA